MSVRVHVVVEHAGDGRPYGCAYIRDLLPLGHPVNAPALTVTHGFDYAPADVVVVERLLAPRSECDRAEELVARARRDGACLVYSIDDALVDMPSLPIEQRMLVRYLAREASAVIVSTSALGARLRGLNPRIHVIPNAIDERLFAPDGTPRPPRAASDGPRVIGYMGTFSHDADLMMVLQPLRQVLRAGAGQVRFELVGGVSDPAVLEAFRGLPLRVHPVGGPDVEYPRFVPWMARTLHWDLGIAPLEDTALNRAKSDIKFLDYSALGIAGVYSQVPAYAATVEDRRTGWLAPESPEAWVEALHTLLTDHSQRLALAHQAQSVVLATRTLAQRAADWGTALRAAWTSA